MSEAQHPETSTKTAIVVISDPRSGHDESLARLFNALASAYEFHAAGVHKFILRPIASGTDDMLKQTKSMVEQLIPEIEAMNG